ncbi:TetR/AcrR family transcriptional regulator [Pauljensenia hongkongensis]|uniref:TetR family transcriptional regulator n=1 Tax=Pauljensenia hongkongensis TaxID=178339 RepID=A0A1D8B126_9ACTO|nr:TetR/AcrR family transcriptional regulator [Pauljensenia hongkongensis]AOS46855.1 TetR family transcriptional regulator [Pauljensenia hongkongensis]WLD79376.1 TetR/AcrR family transcriptional regulator [Schaalia sp. HMT-877]
MNPRDSVMTRAAIVDAASKLLEDSGPEAVTLRAVGEAAGVSRSAPYRHYADKAALMRALAERALRQIARRIRHGAEHHQGEWQRLRAGCQAYIDYAVERPHHYQLVFGDTPIAEPDPGLEEAADNAMAAVGELVAQAQDAGLLRPGPTREIATIVWVLLHGLAALQITGHLHEPRTIDGDEHLADLLNLALEQLRPS